MLVAGERYAVETEEVVDRVKVIAVVFGAVKLEWETQGIRWHYNHEFEAGEYPQAKIKILKQLE